MNIIVEPVRDSHDIAVIQKIREEVFEREMKVALPKLLPEANALHLIARAGSGLNPVAALTVQETSDEVHSNYSFQFDKNTRAARYTQLAVLKEYRGMNIPLMLILEAHYQFIVPNQFQYTWLLFRAEQAAYSSFCRLLLYKPSNKTVISEYGRSRVLLREENTAQSKQAIWQAEQYLNEHCSRFHIDTGKNEQFAQSFNQKGHRVEL